MLAASAEHCGCSTATGLGMTHRTSILRWSVWIHSMQRSVTTQTYSGCVNQWWSIARCAVSLQHHASRVALARVMATARRLVALDVLAGNAVTRWKCTANDKQRQMAVLQDINILACHTLLLCLGLSCFNKSCLFRLVNFVLFHYLTLNMCEVQGWQ